MHASQPPPNPPLIPQSKCIVKAKPSACRKKIYLAHVSNKLALILHSYAWHHSQKNTQLQKLTHVIIPVPLTLWCLEITVSHNASVQLTSMCKHKTLALLRHFVLPSPRSPRSPPLGPNSVVCISFHARGFMISTRHHCATCTQGRPLPPLPPLPCPPPPTPEPAIATLFAGAVPPTAIIAWW